jgi:hypothetical protein
MNFVFEHWKDALALLTKIDSGEVQADPKYWKLFKI